MCDYERHSLRFLFRSLEALPFVAMEAGSLALIARWLRVRVSYRHACRHGLAGHQYFADVLSFGLDRPLDCPGIHPPDNAVGCWAAGPGLL